MSSPDINRAAFNNAYGSESFVESDIYQGLLCSHRLGFAPLLLINIGGMIMTLSKKMGAALLTTALLTATGSALAADGAELYTSKGCNACHGADAKSPIMPAYPKIAGQGKEYLVQQMMDIKSGARNNGQTAAMKGIIAGVSDDEIKAIAGYLAGL